jgi:hypothetical protein
MAKAALRGLALVDHLSLVEPIRPTFAGARHFRWRLLRLSPGLSYRYGDRTLHRDEYSTRR